MTKQQRLADFLALSVEFTAFSEVELYGTGMAQAYLDTADRIVGKCLVDQILDRHAGIATADPADRLAALRRTLLGDERFGPVLRSIVKLWYIGTWFALPADWQQHYGPKPADGTFVVSPTAYVEGLLWPAIGAHPPGAKAPGFGSWQYPPTIPAF